MRHRKSGVKLNRTTSHRQAMFRNMVTSLFKYDRIKTTETKAKELRRWADHIVTLAKRGDLHARRMAMAIVREKDVVHKVFEEATERFGSINGGYTRIIRLGRRQGDAASLTLVELISADGAEPAPTAKTKKRAKQETAATAPAPAAAEPPVAEAADVTEPTETAEPESAGEAPPVEAAAAETASPAAEPVDAEPPAAADTEAADEARGASEDTADDKK